MACIMLLRTTLALPRMPGHALPRLGQLKPYTLPLFTPYLISTDQTTSRTHQITRITFTFNITRRRLVTDHPK
jgi:hypothetical protein